MAIRMAIDTGINYPRPIGAFGGWLKNDHGSRITITKSQNHDFELGIFANGEWESSIVWGKAGVEFKAMRSGDKPPWATDATIVSEQASIAQATLANWQAGTAQHATVTIGSLFVGLTLPGTVWCTISLAGASDAFACCAAGRILVVEN